MVIGTDCTGRCKSNYHGITTTTTPWEKDKSSHMIIYHHKTLQVYKVYKINYEWGNISGDFPTSNMNYLISITLCSDFCQLNSISDFNES